MREKGWRGLEDVEIAIHAIGFALWKAMRSKGAAPFRYGRPLLVARN